MLRIAFALWFLCIWNRNEVHSWTCYYDLGVEVNQFGAFKYDGYGVTVQKATNDLPGCLIFSSREFGYSFDHANDICRNINSTLMTLADTTELQQVWATRPGIPASSNIWHVAKKQGSSQCRFIQNFQIVERPCSESAGFACQYRFRFNCVYHLAWNPADIMDKYMFVDVISSDAIHNKICNNKNLITLSCHQCNNPDVEWGPWSSCSETCTWPDRNSPTSERRVKPGSRTGYEKFYVETKACNVETPCDGVVEPYQPPIPVVTTSVTVVTTSVTTSTTTTTGTTTSASKTTRTTTAKTSTGAAETTGLTESVGSPPGTTAQIGTKRRRTWETTEGGLNVIHIVIIALALFFLIAVGSVCILCWVVKRNRSRRKKKLSAAGSAAGRDRRKTSSASQSKSRETAASGLSRQCSTPRDKKRPAGSAPKVKRRDTNTSSSTATAASAIKLKPSNASTSGSASREQSGPKLCTTKKKPVKTDVKGKRRK